MRKTIGEQIRERRIAAGVTQAELARWAKLAGQHVISKIETQGKYAKGWQAIEAVLRVLGMKSV